MPQAAESGTGTVAEPIERVGGLCLVSGCVKFGHAVRISRSGALVRYCWDHELQAQRLFDAITLVAACEHCAHELTFEVPVADWLDEKVAADCVRCGLPLGLEQIYPLPRPH